MVSCLQTTQHKINQHQPKDSCKPADFRQIFQFICDIIIMQWMYVICACISPTQKEMYVFILLVMYIMIKLCGNDKSLQTKATQQSTWYTWHMWQSGRYTYLVIIPNKIFQLMYFWSKIRGCWRLYIIPWFSYKPSNILHYFHNSKMIC